MTRQVRRLADSVATRRGFLGRIGWGAMAAAAALGGMLASPTVAEAKKDGENTKKKYWCCYYENEYSFMQLCSSGPCPSSYWFLPLVHAKRVGSCEKCPPIGG